jgi:hypothetical protein
VVCTPGKPRRIRGKLKVPVTCKVTLTPRKTVASTHLRLTRGRVTYATGNPVKVRGKLVLTFRAVRRLVRGTYTLTITERGRDGGRTITRHKLRLG